MQQEREDMTAIINKFRQKAHQFIGNSDGTTVIEYALIASAVVLGIVNAVSTLGDNVSSTYTDISEKF